MGIFWGDKKKDELILVFDIGSHSVGGALFYAEKTGVPKIVFSAREPITLQKTLDIDRFLFSTLKSLKIVVDKIYRAGKGKPEAIFCVLSSPWHASQTRVIKLEKNTPFLFTAELAQDLIKKEITLFEGEYLAKYANTKNSVKLIELKNIKTILNGYETSNPLDQTAKELEITIFVSISEELVLKKIEDTIAQHFHFNNVKFSSFTLASFAVVRDVYINQDNFLLINIGGEVTDIFMVKKNILRESISFPLGYNFIIRKVASLLHSSLDEAESFVSLLKDGHATELITKKIDPVVNKLKAEWLAKFQESLSNLSNDVSVPATIYLTTEKEVADFFSETIKTEQFNQYTLTESKFKIIFLGAEIFHGLVAFNRDMISNSSLIIDSIYINRFLTNFALLK